LTQIAVHSLGAVVGGRAPQCACGEAEQAFDLLIDRFVVVEDGVLLRVPRLVQAMLWPEKAPEAVVDAIGAHLDHEKRSHGRVSRRCSATWKRFSVISSIWARRRPFSSVRKPSTSTI
jgi:hypothetical protein